MNPRYTTLLLLFAIGCPDSKLSSGMDGSVDPDEGLDTGTPTEPPPAEILLSTSLPGGRVFDPKLRGFEGVDIAWSIEESDQPCSTSVTITNGIGQYQVLTTDDTEAVWDGRDEESLYFDTGPANLLWDVDCGRDTPTTAEAEVHIIRLGIALVDLRDTEDSAGNIGLAFHKRSLFERNVSAIGERPEYWQGGADILGSNLDHDDGEPRAPVTLWADPDVPPWVDGEADQHNVPAGFIAGSPIAVHAQLGSIAISAARQVKLSPWGPNANVVPQVRMVVNGTPIDSVMGPGGMMTTQIEPAQATMGKEVRTITWSFEAQESDETWTAIPGQIQTDHVLYTLAGEPALLDGTSEGKAPPIPWVGVLDDTATVMEGVAATDADVLDALRDYLFEHDYIIYDPSVGSYTDFEGPYIYWDNITAQLTPFLDRAVGLRLYCHSMSCTLSALAGNHGVHAEQLVLGVYFNTNLTRAAGTDSWNRWSFNSHSVVSPDDGATIWDSSIAVDGDDDPYNHPVEETMPRGMPGDEYFERLTYDEIDIVNQGLCYIE
jgi:hypothetical protein